LFHRGEWSECLIPNPGVDAAIESYHEDLTAAGYELVVSVGDEAAGLDAYQWAGIDRFRPEGAPQYAVVVHLHGVTEDAVGVSDLPDLMALLRDWLSVIRTVRELKAIGGQETTTA
jgi:hypothetical protein